MKFKNFVSLVLVAVVSFSAVPTTVFAESDEDFEERIDAYGLNDISPYLMFDSCSTDGSSSDDSGAVGEGDAIEVGASRFSDGQGYRGDSLRGKKGYAELSNSTGAKDFSAIATLMKLPKSKLDKNGGLPYKTKLKITYKGKSIVAEKLDVGAGGGDVKGKKRAIDLTSTAADALGLTNAIGVDVVTIQLVSGGDSDSKDATASSFNVPSLSQPSSPSTTTKKQQPIVEFADMNQPAPVATLAQSSSSDDYYEKHAGYAYATGQKYKLPWEAILAQSAHESAFGKSELTKKANNFFGFKAGKNWKGDTVTMRTREEKNGSSYYVDAAFRKYASPQEGFDDYGKMITTLPNYKKALEYPNDPEKYIQAIKDGGYATDGSYVEKVVALIKKVQEFAKKHGDKWKPSIPDNAAGGADCSGGSSDAGGGVGVADGFTFPLKTTKSVIKKGIEGAVWCYKSKTNCHHDYNAADIFAPTDTPIIAAKGGVVQALMPSSGSCTSRSTGCNVQVMGEDKILYYYTHMAKPGIVKKGQKVKAGEQIGAVGTNRTAMSTPRHLHFDMLPGDKYSFRVGCAGAACRGYPLINVQPYLIKAFEQLPN